MNWFFLALIPPFLDAIANHVDKHMVSKYLKGGSAGAFVLFSIVFASLTLPVVFVFNWQKIIETNVFDAVLLIANGALIVLASIFYFRSVHEDEASFVAPLFQFIPVISFILGYFMLGEGIGLVPFIGLLAIVFGGLILVFDFDGNKVRFKSRLVVLTLASSFLFAFSGVFFKFIAEDAQAFWPSLFWGLVGKVIFGAIILFLLKDYRQQFILMVKINKFSVLSLAGINEIMAIVSEGVVMMALLLVPVALVDSVGGLYPALVFIMGLFITKFWPSFGEESLLYHHIAQKVTGIIVIILGTLLISVSG